MSDVPLSVLDLIPVSAGATHAEALRNSVDLARQAEAFGYGRYWFAEHHLASGVIGASTAVAIALAGGATRTIRLGSAGVQIGHRTPLSVVEECGLLNAAFPGRLDLGIGRSLSRPEPKGDDGPAPTAAPSLSAVPPSSAVPTPLVGASAPTGAALATSGAAASYVASSGGGSHAADEYTADGLLLPKRFDISKLLASDLLGLMVSLLQQPGAYAPGYAEQIDDVLAFLAGTYRTPAGLPAHASPGEGADVEVWILGASGGVSATVAGERGLPFAASYHHSPSTVLDAVQAYRAAFRPSARLDRPLVAVSADVVVAENDVTAAHLAAGYGEWVLSIRAGTGAIPFPTPEDALARVWTDEERALVADRVRTQLVGSPRTVVDRLEQLRAATGADELAITTITHQHADRVRSYQLLAEEWGRR
ncbi:LLM class flavin-dependent oxidoreductase [Frankia sp. CNm7]|uniref:LLM class flavin-dependent oxidoreductase n=1 Tax=Frankia nepalensis TaxID=1836974 RepID=A0A937RM31_9ACTN|nr:LLM class flavin-dependent oxidoreductase [Frankia nepalensis]MBL7498634.1 LLM class flavin-dependent oxidoreductase [Frankia nepalensis]MBL7509200.1 LLM class flavin-dependent oxidoreductase [Frankia nepalensis]MBL7522738.1 LLM class flavin-dependent oxidoreductase [Frankia nepalensis]MBL7628391.1 LLM class flavin-dependent oxidoreductase [Frankia nepalensis]